AAGPTKDPVQALNRDLLTHDSATEVLTRWCADLHLADPPRIVARRVKAEAPAASPQIRARLKVGPNEPLGFRHVELACGDHVLSEADNWYVPARLTADMNRILATTDTPFGAVVRSLGFHRRTLSARILWRRSRPIPEHILRHRAVLTAADGRPIAVVTETYRRDLLQP